MTIYLVKEAFLSLQGEGLMSGRVTVFCRFAGCNLWSGREADRASARCTFCDTDFVGTNGQGGGRFEGALALADHLAAFWPGGGEPYLVFTGGEPTLQLDTALVQACKAKGFVLGVETNGTRQVVEGLDWICVSPKTGAPIVQRWGDELKVVFPQPMLSFGGLEELDFKHYLIQPMDGPARAANTDAAVAFCLANPRWRLSRQLHKELGVR